MSLEAKIDKILEKLETTQIEIAKLHERMSSEKIKVEKNEKKIEDLEVEVNKLENDVIKIKHFLSIAKKITYVILSGIGTIILFSIDQIISFFK